MAYRTNLATLLARRTAGRNVTNTLDVDAIALKVAEILMNAADDIDAGELTESVEAGAPTTTAETVRFVGLATKAYVMKKKGQRG